MINTVFFIYFVNKIVLMSQTNEKGKKGKIDKKALNKILKKYG